MSGKKLTNYQNVLTAQGKHDVRLVYNVRVLIMKITCFIKQNLHSYEN